MSQYDAVAAEVYRHKRLVARHETFTTHRRNQRVPVVGEREFVTCHAFQFSQMVILPIVERRRLVSERPSFVMRLFKWPACRETQASRITNIVLRHNHCSSAMCFVEKKMNSFFLSSIKKLKNPVLLKENKKQKQKKKK